MEPIIDGMDFFVTSTSNDFHGEQQRDSLLHPLVCMALFPTPTHARLTARNILESRIDPKDERCQGFQRSIRWLMPLHKRSRDSGSMQYSGSRIQRTIAHHGIDHRAQAAFHLEAALWLLQRTALTTWPEPLDQIQFETLLATIKTLPTQDMTLAAQALLGGGQHALADTLARLNGHQHSQLLHLWFGQARNTVQSQQSQNARQWARRRYKPTVFEIDFTNKQIVPSLLALPAPPRQPSLPAPIQTDPAPYRPISTLTRPAPRKRNRRLALLSLLGLSTILLFAFKSDVISPQRLFNWLNQQDRQQITQLQHEARIKDLDLNLAQHRETWFGFGWSNFQLGHYDKAQHMMSKLLQHPDCGPHLRARAHYTLAVIHSNAWRFPEADRQLNMAQTLYESLGNNRGVRAVQMERVAYLQRTEKHGEALVLLNKLQEESPSNTRLFKLAANLHMEMGNPIAALVAAEHWEKSSNSYAEILKAKSHQALCLIVMGDLKTGAAITWDVHTRAIAAEEDLIYTYNLINQAVLASKTGQDASSLWNEISQYARKSGNLDLVRQLEQMTADANW